THTPKLFVFSLLSCADVCLTHHLVENGNGTFYEGNPIASAWLSAYGWTGLITFKGIAVGIVASVTVILSLQRPQAAQRLLNFACIAVGAVVIYSCTLAMSGHAEEIGTEQSAQLRSGPIFPCSSPEQMVRTLARTSQVFRDARFRESSTSVGKLGYYLEQ